MTAVISSVDPIQRVLLVDDSEADNALHAALFHRAGFSGELLCADSGPEALALLASADLRLPTLIVLDINMPGMNGFEFARAAIDYVGDAPVTIVLMVAPHSAAQDRAHAATLPLIRDTAFKPLAVTHIKRLLGLPAQP